MKRWRKQILCIVGSMLIFLASVYEERINSPLIQGYLERGDYGEDSRTYDIIVNGADSRPLSCTVEISPVQYKEEQALNVMEELAVGLPQQILGENESLSQVTTDLNLINSFEGTGVWAIWQSKNPNILDSYGRILAEKIDSEGVEAILSVTLTDGIYSKDEEIPLRIYPPFQNDRERMAGDLQELIQKSNQESPTEKRVMLPGEYDGRPISYRDAGASDYRILPVLGIVLAVLFYGRDKAKDEKDRKQRQQMLLMDYADVVYQLMVYIGAGLTVRKAWECIVQNYEKRKKDGSVQVRPAYEEMALTLNQIQYGVPEGKAIETFGKRCQLPSYMKLSSILEQNRRTGTKNLKQLLEQEMTAAWEEQKHMARRLGEEAGTRLLIPLFLLLVVVMVIIMVPALLAVQ